MVKEFKGYQDSLHCQIDILFGGMGDLEGPVEGHFVFWEVGFQVSSRTFIGSFELLLMFHPYIKHCPTSGPITLRNGTRHSCNLFQHLVLHSTFLGKGEVVPVALMIYGEVEV